MKEQYSIGSMFFIDEHDTTKDSFFLKDIHSTDHIDQVSDSLTFTDDYFIDDITNE